MKLLSKPAINSAKALERSLEISEGKKLAESVDKLRCLRSDEEANLKKFREQTMKTVRAEIDAAINKRDAIKTEVAWLEDLKKKALEPVNLKQQELFDREEAVLKRENAASATRAEHIETLGQIDEARLELKGETRQLDEKKEAVEKLLKEAQALDKQARERKRAAEALYDEAAQKSNQIAEALLKRELDIAARERDTKNRNEHLDRVQKELNARERGIIDKEETLSRELKRIIQ